MSRQLKFRAWDKVAENMFIIFDANEQTEWFLPKWKDRYEVMQYTGLKDKNGKEIYDGDIVLAEGEKWKVSFLEGCFIGTRVKDDTWDCLCNISIPKIIGNIHDNLEPIGLEDDNKYTISTNNGCTILRGLTAKKIVELSEKAD